MYKGIENIVLHDKEAIKLAMKQWSTRRTNPVREDIQLLFDKFHEYVYRSPADMSCPSCVQYIYDYWTKQIKKWQEIEH